MANSLYPLTERQARFIDLAQALAGKFRTRAAEFDRRGQFPLENYDDIRQSGLPKLVVPAEYGGWGANLLETLLTIEALAIGDGSTALSFTMHLQTLGGAAERRTWPQALFDEICRAVVERGALLNFIATEPELGSPSRGGKPKTTAKPVAATGEQPAGYLLNGRKNFASMSPALDYMIVLAALEDGSDQTAHFVVTPGDGVEVVETWDAMGMRATGSHDVVLTDVFVPAQHMIPPAQQTGPKVNPWFPLSVSTVYMGVAAAALECAAQFAQERVPTALGKPIAELENIQRRLGQAELLLHQARTHLYHTAELWDRCPDRRPDLAESIMVAKYTATNNAVAIVDQCMRVVGGSAMSRALPLERYYRDVRGGLTHPMNDDQALQLLGQMALARHPLQEEPLQEESR